MRNKDKTNKKKKPQNFTETQMQKPDVFNQELAGLWSLQRL